MKNRYPDRESELLGNLQEECLEVAKIVSKIMRFTETGKPIPADKIEKLNAEIGDVIGCLELLSNEEDILVIDLIEKGMRQKVAKLSDPERFSHVK